MRKVSSLGISKTLRASRAFRANRALTSLRQTMKSAAIYAPKGHESTAQGLPWVRYIEARPEEALVRTEKTAL
jgi:hypothetical protein